MTHQLTVAAGQHNVLLPNGLRYRAGDVATLSDRDYSAITPAALSAIFSSDTKLPAGVQTRSGAAALAASPALTVAGSKFAPISLIGGVGIAGGDHTSPQVLSYASAAGHTMIVTGHFYEADGLSDFPTGISDDAGNTWHVSTGSAQNPPTAQIIAAGQCQTDFVAWTFQDVGPVTAVTIGDQNSQWWRVSLTEWANIGGYDDSWSGTATGALTFTTGAVNLSSPGSLVVGAVDSLLGPPAGLPSGWTQLPGAGAINQSYIIPGVSGPFSVLWTGTQTDDWAGAVAAFHPA